MALTGTSRDWYRANHDLAIPASSSGRSDFLNIDECAQRPQPGFVASPARDRGAIDRLPGLPFAGGPHRPRIGLGAKASFVPRQAAGGDDSADDWFGLAGQLRVIDFDEAIRRQHASPMLGEPSVAPEIRHQFVTSG